MSQVTCMFFICMYVLHTALASFPADVNWLNDFDQPMTFTCPNSKQVISNIYSEHSNGAEDRRFKMACRDIGGSADDSVPSCAWTPNFANQLDQLLDYECPGNGYFNGMSSVHDNGAEDRRWKIYCCSIPTIHLFDCERTGHTNDFDGVQNFEVPQGKAIKAVLSMHDNGPEDRWYEYDICNLSDSLDIHPIVG